MTVPILEGRQLQFGYAPEKPVIHDLSLTIDRGTLCAVIGPNGGGKSTLVRLFAGILKPASGDILIQGTNLRAMAGRRAAQELAYVPQSSAMVFPFTVLEVVLTGRSPYRPPFRFENDHDRRVAEEALAMVEASHLAERPVTALSGGEQQLVAVARALAQEPKCLLLDEPSASLDLRHRAALMRTLIGLRNTLGLTICVVTHDLHLIDSAFDRVMALRDGKFVADGRPREVLTDSTLATVYEDGSIRTHTYDGRTLVWCD